MHIGRHQKQFNDRRQIHRRQPQRSSPFSSLSQDLHKGTLKILSFFLLNFWILIILEYTHTQVTSSYGNTFHHAEDVDSGQFAFTAVEAGDYMACFTANGHKPEVTLSIDFDWRTGIHSKSWGSVAKKSQVEVSLFIFVW